MGRKYLNKIFKLSLILIILLSFINIGRISRKPSFTTNVLAQESPGTLDDYWNGRAYFQFQNLAKVPIGSVQNLFQYDAEKQWIGPFGGGNAVRVRNGIWYMFTAEYLPNPPSYCNSGQGVSAQIVVRKSTDKGQTWSNKSKIIQTREGTPNECLNVDGDAYFEESTKTWHFLYQCLARDNIWNLCHATRQSEDPMGEFVQNPANPVIRSRALWSQLLPGQGIYDEGTPEIIEKVGEYYYVTFHGFDGIRGFRGLAKTKNFTQFEKVMDGSIFDKVNCQNWNVAWDINGCVGGGAATTLKENGFYYMVIEAMDKNLICAEGQNWTFGIVRSNILNTKNWANPADKFNPIITSTKELDVRYNKGFACAVQYARLFKDSNGDIYLRVDRSNGKDIAGIHRITDMHLYKLVKNAPLVSYKFRERPCAKIELNQYDLNCPTPPQYVNSDTISKGNFEANVQNVKWGGVSVDSTFYLDFNGSNSYFEVDNPNLNLTNNFSNSIKVKIDILPTTTSSLISGKVGAYWLELYNDGNLCAWVKESATNELRSTCSNIQNDLGKWLTITQAVKDNALTLSKNNITLSSTQISPGGVAVSNEKFKLGNNTASQVYSSFKGSVDEVNIYDYALLSNTPAITNTPTPIPNCSLKSQGDADCNGIINLNDFEIFRKEFNKTLQTLTSDFNNNGAVTLSDFEIWRSHFPH
jgi:hypothetical protein